MINAKIVSCGLCRNYYADPRQIPCAHSFCFDCISGRFDEETLTLTCPKCDKIHHYDSFEEFHNQCMPDGFLATMVAQFKRSQSRSIAVSAGLLSRPSSAMSRMSPSLSSKSTPCPWSQALDSNQLDQTDSNRSTPSVSQQPAARALIAKCQSCNVRGELIVCSHCDNVICVRCIEEHQRVTNDDVRREWNLCKATYETNDEQFARFDTDQEQMKRQARQLQKWIGDQSDRLIRTLDTQKHDYTTLIENHRRTYKQSTSFAQEQVIDEYESIDKRVRELLRSNDISADRLNDFLFEIQHLEGRLDGLNKVLDSSELNFPVLTLPAPIDASSLLGSLEFVPFQSQSTQHDPYAPKATNGFDLPRRAESNTVLVPLMDSSERHFPPPLRPLESSLSVSKTAKKKLLWQIDYFSVPYYVRTLDNQLFVCDKYGSLAIYKFNDKDVRQKPTLQREIKLFKDNATSALTDEDQTIIDSFVVYKLWIIVFKRRKNELHGTIYLFAHDGKLIPNGKCAHNYPSRELTMDTDVNRLWSLDQKQLCLFYYDLPDAKVSNPEKCLQNRCSHVHFAKPFAPIHISVNKHVLAVLDKNRQAVHVYDKQTKQQLYEHVNMHSNTTHFCWDMALFSDDSLLIKLDEMSSLKGGPSKHVYLQLDTVRQRDIIGTIEETDAYGMMITPTDEILIGIRINTKGIVKCYV